MSIRHVFYGGAWSYFTPQDGWLRMVIPPWTWVKPEAIFGHSFSEIIKR